MSQQTGMRLWEPWGVGLTRLLLRLLDTGAIDNSFVHKVVELGHDRRYYLVNYIIVHYISQICHCLTTNQSAQAITLDEIAALERLCCVASYENKDIVHIIRQVVHAVNALFADKAGDSVLDRRLGPPTWWVIDETGEYGVRIRASIIRWAIQELDRLDQLIRRDMFLGSKAAILTDVRDYSVIQHGMDYIAVHSKYVHRLHEIVALDTVNPLECPPEVFIAPTIEGLRQRIEQHIGGAEISNSRKPLLGNSRDIGRRGIALGAYQSKRFQLAALDIRQHGGHVRKRSGGPTAKHVDQDRCYALVGYMRNVEFGRDLKLLNPQVSYISDSG